jgi:hypothetical protein
MFNDVSEGDQHLNCVLDLQTFVLIHSLVPKHVTVGTKYEVSFMTF